MSESLDNAFITEKKKFFLSPRVLSIINFILISTIIIGNILFQVFCIPTLWASVLLFICFSCCIIYPLKIKNNRFVHVISFLNGISFCIFIYCILFLEEMNLESLILILVVVGLVTYVPHFFAVQLFWNYVLKPTSNISRIFFFAGIFTSVLMAFYFGHQYRKAIVSIEKFEKSNFTVLEKNYYTEKILGMHFIYHTRLCIYDGWRPPKHDPALIIGMWLNKRVDPLHVSLEKRLSLYKQFFPDNKVKFSCSCALNYSSDYHNDSLWK
ncbi:MAG: hypothetical protein U0U67_10465 [Chitinophagales bacterium]